MFWLPQLLCKIKSKLNHNKGKRNVSVGDRKMTVDELIWKELEKHAKNKVSQIELVSASPKLIEKMKRLSTIRSALIDEELREYRLNGSSKIRLIPASDKLMKKMCRLARR